MIKKLSIIFLIHTVLVPFYSQASLVSLEEEKEIAQTVLHNAISKPQATSIAAKEILSEEVVVFLDAINQTSLNDHDKALIIQALEFAALQHQDQYRNMPSSPHYLTHPITVALILLKEGQVEDPTLIIGALLHDVLDHNPSAYSDIKRQFGAKIASICEELSYGHSPQQISKLIIELGKTEKMSKNAKLIKLADRITNLRELQNSSSLWSPEKVKSYKLFSEAMLAHLKGSNSKLEAIYQELLEF